MSASSAQLPAPALSIRSNRLELRRLVAEDAAFVLELVNDPDWLRHIGDRGVHTLDDARDYLETGPMAMYAHHGIGLLAVVRRDSGAPIGMCGLLKRDTLPDIDIGYAFLPAGRGRGYAREAVMATLAAATRDLGLRRVVAITAPGNLASIKLLESVGFGFERNMHMREDGDEVCLFGYPA